MSSLGSKVRTNMGSWCSDLCTTTMPCLLSVRPDLSIRTANTSIFEPPLQYGSEMIGCSAKYSPVPSAWPLAPRRPGSRPCWQMAPMLASGEPWKTRRTERSVAAKKARSNRSYSAPPGSASGLAHTSVICRKLACVANQLRIRRRSALSTSRLASPSAGSCTRRACSTRAAASSSPVSSCALASLCACSRRASSASGTSASTSIAVTTLSPLEPLRTSDVRAAAEPAPPPAPRLAPEEPAPFTMRSPTISTSSNIMLSERARPRANEPPDDEPPAPSSSPSSSDMPHRSIST
mmetsp:Transcript_57737/g.151616  ORF Transcript_57737/g.151616 Transcript_57737/m.151616 type:complete len:293 (-) Transcript_57737:284-1162(-)